MTFKAQFFLYKLSKQIKLSGNKIFLTTAEFGKILNVSQQSASRYLKILESEGLIHREVSGNGQTVTITEKGETLLREMYDDIGNFFSAKTKKILEGFVTSGLGEGAYYIKVYSEKLQEKLHFKPYPGTLNIKTTMLGDLERYSKEKIDSFSESGRVFGTVHLIPVSISKDTQTEKCYVILPERTHHKNEIELISEKNLRSTLKLKDGDTVKIEIAL